MKIRRRSPPFTDDLNPRFLLFCRDLGIDPHETAPDGGTVTVPDPENPGKVTSRNLAFIHWIDRMWADWAASLGFKAPDGHQRAFREGHSADEFDAWLRARVQVNGPYLQFGREEETRQVAGLDVGIVKVAGGTVQPPRIGVWVGETVVSVPAHPLEDRFQRLERVARAAQTRLACEPLKPTMTSRKGSAEPEPVPDPICRYPLGTQPPHRRNCQRRATVELPDGRKLCPEHAALERERATKAEPDVLTARSDLRETCISCRTPIRKGERYTFTAKHGPKAKLHEKCRR